MTDRSWSYSLLMTDLLKIWMLTPGGKEYVVAEDDIEEERQPHPKISYSEVKCVVPDIAKDHHFNSASI